jgi:hypothetical protein
MQGLYAAATAVQSAEFLRLHGHLLEQPQGASAEILEQLTRAAQVCAPVPGCKANKSSPT